MKTDLTAASRLDEQHAQPSLLLLDVDETARDECARLFRERGYRVEAYGSAHDALEALARGTAPNIILLELALPEMNGWEFRARLLREPSWSPIPLVVITADRSAQARAIHAAAFLAKPVSSELLLQTVDRLLHQPVAAFAQASSPGHADSARAQSGQLLSPLAGIAHEINNSLAYVRGTLELAESKARELESRLRGAEAFSMVGLRQLIMRAQRGADRIVGVVRELEQSKRVLEELRAIDVHDTGLGRELPVRTLDTRRLREASYRDRLYASQRPPRGEPSYLRASKPRPSVLVVDDESMICEIVNDILEEDYNVVAFTDPRAALATLLSGSFDVIVCDLLMPELTGMDLYEQLARQRPELTERLIFLSGGGFTEVCRDFLARVRRPQVKKPFHHFELLDAIEEQLTPKH